MVTRATRKLMEQHGYGSCHVKIIRNDALESRSQLRRVRSMPNLVSLNLPEIDMEKVRSVLKTQSIQKRRKSMPTTVNSMSSIRSHDDDQNIIQTSPSAHQMVPDDMGECSLNNVQEMDLKQSESLLIDFSDSEENQIEQKKPETVDMQPTQNDSVINEFDPFGCTSGGSTSGEKNITLLQTIDWSGISNENIITAKQTTSRKIQNTTQSTTPSCLPEATPSKATNQSDSLKKVRIVKVIPVKPGAKRPMPGLISIGPMKLAKQNLQPSTSSSQVKPSNANAFQSDDVYVAIKRAIQKLPSKSQQSKGESVHLNPIQFPEDNLGPLRYDGSSDSD